MKIEVSKWGKTQKNITIAAGFINIIDSVIALIWKISILGGSIGCISLSIFLLGLGLRQVNLFKDSNEKSDLILGVILIVIFTIFLYTGIILLQGYIYTIRHT